MHYLFLKPTTTDAVTFRTNVECPARPHAATESFVLLYVAYVACSHLASVVVLLRVVVECVGVRSVRNVRHVHTCLCVCMNVCHVCTVCMSVVPGSWACLPRHLTLLTSDASKVQRSRARSARNKPPFRAARARYCAFLQRLQRLPCDWANTTTFFYDYKAIVSSRVWSNTHYDYKDNSTAPFGQKSGKRQVKQPTHRPDNLPKHIVSAAGGLQPTTPVKNQYVFTIKCTGMFFAFCILHFSDYFTGVCIQPRRPPPARLLVVVLVVVVASTCVPPTHS